MAQRTILSFFGPKQLKEKCNKTSEKDGADSPIKASGTTVKRSRVLSSSSDEETESKSKKSKKLLKSLSQFTNSNDVNKKIPHVKEDELESKTPPAENKSPSPTTTQERNCKDITDYNPNISKYHPIKDACWGKMENTPYYALSRTLEEIENTSARLKIIEILSNYLRSVLVLRSDDFLPSIYLCLNKIGPAYEGLELGIAEQTLIRAISQSTGRSFSQIKADVQETGDLGVVAEKSRSSQKLMFKPVPLTVDKVFRKFREIAEMTGQASVNKKISIIQSLLVSCRGAEAKYLIRSLNGKLRIGLAEQSVLQAIALACATTPPNKTDLNCAKNVSAEKFKSELDKLALILKTTYCECPNYNLIVPVLLKEGIEGLPKHCRITPGIPVKPMLAQPTKGVQEVLSRFDGLEFTCEWKYDGERAQIHCLEGGTIKIYSRNQEDNTSKYPDIISRLPLALKTNEAGEKLVKTCILDCEAVAWDKEENRILPFQVLSTRKRKDANEADIKVHVCIFMFDLLYLNGKSLIKEPFVERRRLLKEYFQELEGQWKYATAIDTSKMEEMHEFLEVSIKGHCEGLMVKTLKEEATYEIAKRSRNWLKLKKDYLEGVGDTLDLIVMGGYLGKGKRTGTYGGFLVGCYDESSEEYQTICKIGTGFSDESLQTHTDFFKNHILSKPPSYYRFDPSIAPDHWFEAVQVWETRCADLSLSPLHRAAIGLIDPVKGISLRFPRFLRVRDDKKPEEGTSARQIADMYKNQDQIQAGSTNFNEEDFY